MSTPAETTYEFEGKTYRKTGERRMPRKGEVFANRHGYVMSAPHDFHIVEHNILEEVTADIPQVVVSFLHREAVAGNRQPITVGIPRCGTRSAQGYTANALREHWDKLAKHIESTVLIHIAFAPTSAATYAWSWTIARNDATWRTRIQPVIDELSKPKRPALLDDPRYVAAVEHVNNVLAKFDKPPVERLEPSNRKGGLRACNCPISVTVNKALGFEPTGDKAYFDPRNGVTAYTTAAGTQVLAPSNGDWTRLHDVEAELRGFVDWADIHGKQADEALAEARDA